ncbi:hypothetical protein T484DRAFT_1982351 [Baffinella frigidus]|nr:hypothetical protein T484DRAFT_1982351 [Cryptophyta sp. CCMP2293]
MTQGGERAGAARQGRPKDSSYQDMMEQIMRSDNSSFKRALSRKTPCPEDVFSGASSPAPTASPARPGSPQKSRFFSRATSPPPRPTSPPPRRSEPQLRQGVPSAPTADPKSSTSSTRAFLGAFGSAARLAQPAQPSSPGGNPRGTGFQHAMQSMAARAFRSPATSTASATQQDGSPFRERSRNASPERDAFARSPERTRNASPQRACQPSPRRSPESSRNASKNASPPSSPRRVLPSALSVSPTRGSSPTRAQSPSRSLLRTSPSRGGTPLRKQLSLDSLEQPKGVTFAQVVYVREISPRNKHRRRSLSTG